MNMTVPSTVLRCFNLVMVSFFGSDTFCAAFLMSPSLLDFLNLANADDIGTFKHKTYLIHHISSAI